MNRRDFLRLSAAGGGAVFLSGLNRGALAAYDKDFYFVQLSDSHWGYQGPANPEARETLKSAVAAVNALEDKPDFVIFTGDLTHTTDDPAERRKRMAEFKAIAGELNVKPVYFIPGEHDASLDKGAAFIEAFGSTHGSFDHKGVHFVRLDNVSEPGATLGEAQLTWLAADLAAQKKNTPIIVFAHRPLFDLAPQWDWATRDGQKAVDILMPYPNVTVFYGHIHQENHHNTGHIEHHAAKSLIFPLPAPGSQEKRTPLPWNPEQAGHGLGFREVEAESKSSDVRITELLPTGAKA